MSSRIYQGKSDHLKYITTKLLSTGCDFPEIKKLILQAIRIPFHQGWGFFPSLVLALKGKNAILNGGESDMVWPNTVRDTSFFLSLWNPNPPKHNPVRSGWSDTGLAAGK